MADFVSYSGYGRTRGGKRNLLLSPMVQPSEEFPTRPVMDFSDNLPANGAVGADIIVQDDNDFSFTDNIWPAGWVNGDPRPDTTSDKPFSISAWVQVTDNAPTHGAILGKYDGNTACEWLLYARAAAAGGEGAGLYWMLFSDGGNYGANVAHVGSGLPLQSGANRLRLRTNNAQVLSNGVWHHVVATYDGSRVAEGLNIYVDSVLVEDIPNSNIERNTDNYTGMLATNLPLRIGDDERNVLMFESAMTDVAIYNIELTAEDTKVLYNKGKVLNLARFDKFSSVVGWWKMGPGDNAQTALEQINNNNGVINQVTIAQAPASTGPFATEGFDTEGQRYLHLTITEAGAAGVPTVEVWALTRAAGHNRWTRLSTQIKPSAGNLDPGLRNTFLGIQDSTVTHRIELFGIDKVFFIWQGDGANVTIGASCSTF